MQRRRVLDSVLVIALLSLNTMLYAQSAADCDKEKTAFQTGSPWMPEIDVRSDIAIVYGANDRPEMTFKERVDSWRKHGYHIHFMTGMAWGDYKDYYLGKWDGKKHLDVTQVQQNGDRVSHGELNPYVVPVESYIEYFKSDIIKKVIDAGITSVYLEEPEFWAKSGYSNPFREEWQKYYGFPWRPQDESPENTYLSNKLKYHLYYHAIEEVSNYAKEYGKSKGIDVKVYIPTHSLVNYSSWQIVSPEASLASLPGIDGYIAQVWTGTSRAPNYFNGERKERVFENAFLEYGSMVSMTAPTRRKIFFLTDPIEDGARDWADYKRNYEATFTAKLLYPMVNDYEVMPWPERIYTHPYNLPGNGGKVLIPGYYSTQIQVMINALNDMPLSGNNLNGSKGIGVLMCNSLMFQRFPVHDGYDDPLFSNFYGQTLPLLKRGVPVQLVHMENLGYKESLANIKVLIMSYSNMKPLTEESHRFLAGWVKQGGVLVYCGEDNDPYQTVQEWWNTKKNHFAAPSEHLFKIMDVPKDARDGKYRFGQGTVYIIRKNPKAFVLKKNNDKQFLQVVRDAYEKSAKAGDLIFKNNFYLERGPYDIISVMDENNDEKPFVVKGPVIDLFNPELPVLTEKVVGPGTQAFLYDLKRVVNGNEPEVLAAAARVSDEIRNNGSYSFIARSPLRTTNNMRIHLPARPKSVVLKDHEGKDILTEQLSWDVRSETCFLSFGNRPEGIHVTIEF